jgi:HK97 family phage major capsid protein
MNDKEKVFAAAEKILPELRAINDTYEAREAVKAELDALSPNAKAALHNMRGKSKASLLGDGPKGGADEYDGGQEKAKVHKSVKAVYQSADDTPAPGALLTAISLSRSSDMDDQVRGKEMLRSLHVQFDQGPRMGNFGAYGVGGSVSGLSQYGKATLGATGATGGYVLPNNLVAPVQKPAIGEALYTMGDNPLCTVVSGVAVRGVDQPFRTGAPTRALFSDWGQTKENRNEIYGSYAAILGTLALVYDISNQYLRFSGGAAEADVFDELAKAFRLAEKYAVLAGPGTGTYGSGDPTMGIYPAILASDPAFTTTFTGASTSTIAGNAATGIAQGIGALVGRSQVVSAVVMDYSTYWTLWTEGSDTAGFFASGAAMGGARALAASDNGQLHIFGVPVFYDPQFNSYTGSTKAAIAGNWKNLKVWRGSEFRIDSSSVAGTRWDQNLTGYRGEEELAVHAGAAVATGSFQLIKNIIP